MPRKNAMRDNVSAVRSQLPHLANLPREKIELALLYYESNIDATIEAFKRDGAIEALSGWTEMSSSRGGNSSKRSNNKLSNKDNKSLSLTPTSNGILRPSQRVSNIFQTFAEGGTPSASTNGKTDTRSSSFLEQSNSSLEAYTPTELSFHPCLSQDSTTNNNNNSQLLLSSLESTQNDFHNISNGTTNSSATADETNVLRNHFDQDNYHTHETNGHNGKPQRRRSTRNRNGSTSSMSLAHEQAQQSSSDDNQQSINNSMPSSTETTTTKTVTKPSSSSHPVTFNNNKKLLTKSTKDLQRQTSTLTNVELSFENEIKSSIKRIDDVFKQVREIIKEREVELYLEMDKVKEQGLNIIHNRQQRGTELRQRVDRCDCLEPAEIDDLRTDIKQFVTERRYDLGEELTTSHRFQYDQSLLEALKTFGTVLSIDRKYDRSRTLSTSSALAEQHGTKVTEKNSSEISTEKIPTSVNNARVSPANDRYSSQHQQPLPRTNRKQHFNGNHIGDHYENNHTQTSVNGFYQYYDDSNNYQTMNRRRPQKQQQQQNKYPQHFNENNRRARPVPSSNNNNNRRNGLNNNDTKHPPQSSLTITPPVSN